MLPLGQDLGFPQKSLRVYVLLLLQERPAHGYELVASLKGLGIDASPSRVYRALRWLEDAGTVCPHWIVAPTGPARRVYELSAEGRQALDLAVTPLWREAKKLRSKDVATRYLVERLRAIAGTRATFTCLVEAQAAVSAGNPREARRRIERVFAGPHVLDDPDVQTRGVVVREVVVRDDSV